MSSPPVKAYRPFCQKCSSFNIYIEREGRANSYALSSEILICYVCGNRVYGMDKIEPIFREQKAKHLLDARKQARKVGAPTGATPSRRRRQPAPPRVKLQVIRVGTKSTWSATHRKQQGARAKQGLCANLHCNKSRGNPAPTLTSSMYCSRQCSNRNAHYRDKLRKEALREKENVGPRDTEQTKRAVG